MAMKISSYPQQCCTFLNSSCTKCVGCNQIYGCISRLKLSSKRTQRFCVTNATGGTSSSSHSPSKTRSRIFVANLPWSCYSEELAKVLQRVGVVEHVEEVEVICDRETGRSRGFGYVTLTTSEAAQIAVQNLDGYPLQGRSLKASISQPTRRRTQVKEETATTTEPAAVHTKLFVGNLPRGVDEGSLEEFFRSHGKVVDVRVIYDRDTGRSRGFGFVTLSSLAEADEAIQSLDGADCDGRKINVKLAASSSSTQPQ